MAAISLPCFVYLIVSIIIACSIWAMWSNYKLWTGFPLLIDNNFKDDDETLTIKAVEKIIILQNRIFWIILFGIFFGAILSMCVKDILDLSGAVDFDKWDIIFTIFTGEAGIDGGSLILIVQVVLGVVGLFWPI
jgi:hypothetical protein